MGPGGPIWWSSTRPRWQRGGKGTQEEINGPGGCNELVPHSDIPVPPFPTPPRGWGR